MIPLLLMLYGYILLLAMFYYISGCIDLNEESRPEVSAEDVKDPVFALSPTGSRSSILLAAESRCRKRHPLEKWGFNSRLLVVVPLELC